MPTPQFVLDLRTRIGNDLLLLPGVRSVIFDDRVRPRKILLGKRSDNGQWQMPAGMVEPGEQPAQALVREVMEETGVEIAIDRLISVVMLPKITYPNGDQVEYLSCAFRGHYVSGEAHVADDESTEVGWYDLDQLPGVLADSDQELIKLGLPVDAPPVFHR